MKLNLVPKHVAKGGQGLIAAAIGVVVAVVGIGAAVILISSASGRLATAKEAYSGKLAEANRVVETAAEADVIAQKATEIVRNQKLAEAMLNKNTAYTNLYRGVLGYVPDFFRPTSISAVPNGEAEAIITMAGRISSFQQYADLMLALMKIPGAKSVTRNGYNVNGPFVPAVSETDPNAVVIKRNDQPMPNDPIERMNRVIADASNAPSGFLGTGSFGNEDPGQRGAMPGDSEVTVSVILAYNEQLAKQSGIDPRIQAVDVRSSLSPVSPATGGGGGGTPNAPGGGGFQANDRS